MKTLTLITFILSTSISALAGNYYCKTQDPVYQDKYKPSEYGYGFVLVKNRQASKATEVRTSGALPFADYNLNVTRLNSVFYAHNNKVTVTIHEKTLLGLIEYANGGSIQLNCQKDVKIGR